MRAPRDWCACGKRLRRTQAAIGTKLGCNQVALGLQSGSNREAIGKQSGSNRHAFICRLRCFLNHLTACENARALVGQAHQARADATVRGYGMLVDMQ